jgi:hypothetical protein
VTAARAATGAPRTAPTATSSSARRGHPAATRAHPPRIRPSAWSTMSAGRDRAADDASSAATPDHAKHQHHHDHDDQHPQPCRHGGLLGRRRAVQTDATAGHPSKQLGHRRATTRARIDGRTGSRGPRSGLSGFKPRPASQAPDEEDPAGVNRPKATTASPTGGSGKAEKRLPCLGGGTMGAWPWRCAMADGAAPDRCCALRRNGTFGVSPDADRVGLGGWSTPSRARVDYLGRP